MKKRLRKKKHLGEFKLLFFEIRGRLKTALDEAEADAWQDALIDFVGSHQLGITGCLTPRLPAPADSFWYMVTRHACLRSGRRTARTCTESDRALFSAPEFAQRFGVVPEVGNLIDNFAHERESTP